MDTSIIQTVLQGGALAILGYYFLRVQPDRDDKILNAFQDNAKAERESFEKRTDALVLEISNMRQAIPQSCKYAMQNGKS